jgi:hypothetical protein
MKKPLTGFPIKRPSTSNELTYAILRLRATLIFDERFSVGPSTNHPLGDRSLGCRPWGCRSAATSHSSCDR